MLFTAEASHTSHIPGRLRVDVGESGLAWPGSWSWHRLMGAQRGKGDSSCHENNENMLVGGDSVTGHWNQASRITMLIFSKNKLMMMNSRCFYYELIFIMSCGFWLCFNVSCQILSFCRGRARQPNWIGSALVKIRSLASFKNEMVKIFYYQS